MGCFLLVRWTVGNSNMGFDPTFDRMKTLSQNISLLPEPEFPPMPVSRPSSSATLFVQTEIGTLGSGIWDWDRIQPASIKIKTSKKESGKASRRRLQIWCLKIVASRDLHSACFPHSKRHLKSHCENTFFTLSVTQSTSIWKKNAKELTSPPRVQPMMRSGCVQVNQNPSDKFPRFYFA